MARIAVLDDEDTIRNAIVRVPERDGHEVLAFEDAAQVWKR